MSKTVWKQAAIFRAVDKSFDFTPGVDFDQLLLRFVPITSPTDHTQVSFSGTENIVFDIFTKDEGTAESDGTIKTHSVMMPRVGSGVVQLKPTSGSLSRDTDELVLNNTRRQTGSCKAR